MSDIHIEVVNDDGDESLTETNDDTLSTTTTSLESEESSKDVKGNTTSQKTDSSSSASMDSNPHLNAFLREKESRLEKDLSKKSCRASNMSKFANEGSVSSDEEDNTGTSMTEPLVTDPEGIALPALGYVRRQIRPEERRLCLEANCLCRACMNELLFIYDVALAFFINVKKEYCVDCGHQAPFKDYQLICEQCSRCTNKCIRCRDAPVVENGEYCNFESLLAGEHDTTFKALNHKTQIRIVDEVYKAYDMFDNFDESVRFAKTVFRYLIVQFLPKSP